MYSVETPPHPPGMLLWFSQSISRVVSCDSSSPYNHVRCIFSIFILCAYQTHLAHSHPAKPLPRLSRRREMGVIESPYCSSWGCETFVGPSCPTHPRNTLPHPSSSLLSKRLLSASLSLSLSGSPSNECCHPLSSESKKDSRLTAGLKQFVTCVKLARSVCVESQLGIALQALQSLQACKPVNMAWLLVWGMGCHPAVPFCNPCSYIYSRAYFG